MQLELLELVRQAHAPCESKIAACESKFAALQRQIAEVLCPLLLSLSRHCRVPCMPKGTGNTAASLCKALCPSAAPRGAALIWLHGFVLPRGTESLNAC